jgi:hypothetical protein
MENKMVINISEAYTYGVSDEAAQEFVDYRKMIKKPLTQRAFDRALMQACKCASELDCTADYALELSIDKGWQAPTFEYIKAELERRHEAANRQAIVLHKSEERKQGIIDRMTDRSWSH